MMRKLRFNKIVVNMINEIASIRIGQVPSVL
jgi:hypothetical protein